MNRVGYPVKIMPKWPDTGVSTERSKPVSCHLLESRVSILKRKLWLATTTLRKTWCASATKASATLTTTESTVWNHQQERGIHHRLPLLHLHDVAWHFASANVELERVHL